MTQPYYEIFTLPNRKQPSLVRYENGVGEIVAYFKNEEVADRAREELGR